MYDAKCPWFQAAPKLPRSIVVGSAEAAPLFCDGGVTAENSTPISGMIANSANSDRMT